MRVRARMREQVAFKSVLSATLVNLSDVYAGPRGRDTQMAS